MPDLKTALQSALNEWNEPESNMQTTNTASDQRPPGTRFFTRTTDVSRATFDYVKAHPNCYTRDVCNALQARGYKKTSVSSLLSQMSRTGMISRTSDGQYVAVYEEYAPVKLSLIRRSRNTPTATGRNPKPASAPTAAAQAKPRIVLHRKEVTMTQPPAPISSPTAPKPVASFNSVDELIDQLTVRQAIELFNKLKGMLA